MLAPYAPHALWVFHDLVEAAMYTGREAAAAAHIAAARECRLDRLSPRLRLVVLASAAIAEPETDTAALEYAITEPGNDRWPFDLARIQLAYGAALRRVKRTTEARQQLAGAAKAFHRLGAVPWAARADRELRATGVTIAKTDAGLASLTPQQRRSRCWRPRAIPTRRSRPGCSSPRGRSPPTCTRCSPNSGSRRGRPCAMPWPGATRTRRPRTAGRRRAAAAAGRSAAPRPARPARRRRPYAGRTSPGGTSRPGRR